MKKDNIRGWKDVFTFTVVQALKSKAYIVTLIIMMVIAMVSMPIVNLVLANGVDVGPEKSAVEKVYLYNMTLYRNLDFDSELSGAYQHIVFKGIMGMATFTDDESVVRSDFAALREIFDTCRMRFPSIAQDFTELSIGMSDDYPVAIEYGSTMVRIGSMIFGARA